MQRNQMTTAVIAGLAGACGIGETTAASLNPDRLGQVLLYPYYTVDGVERSADADRGRVVKVRFL
jgi:ABC-type phosphate/phosphonate transport system permease subunit